MSAREFEAVIHPVEGHRIRTYTLRCAKCGCVGNIGQVKFGADIAASQVPKKFTAKGWTVGRRAADDLCPEHTRQAEEARRMKPKLYPIEAAVRTLVADKPREMSFTDKRLIIAKLEEVYISEDVGYDSGWDDNLVARDLGVPRAWVEEIRDANFGPIKVDEKAVEIIRKAKELADRADGIITEVKAHRTRVEELTASIIADVARFREDLAKIAPAALGRSA